MNRITQRLIIINFIFKLFECCKCMFSFMVFFTVVTTYLPLNYICPLIPFIYIALASMLIFWQIPILISQFADLSILKANRHFKLVRPLIKQYAERVGFNRILFSSSSASDLSLVFFVFLLQRFLFSSIS